MNLSTLRPGDWMNLKDDLGVLHGYSEGGFTRSHMGGILTTPIGHPSPKELSEGDLRKLQEETRRLLGDHADAEMKSAGWTKMTPVPLAFSLAVLPRSGLIAQGPTRDMTLLQLAFLLAQNPRQRAAMPGIGMRSSFLSGPPAALLLEEVRQ